MKYVGQDYPIHDANIKVNGQIKYISDMELPGMLYAKLVLSPVAHAEILNIDASEALKVPGVLKVYTHENTPKTRFNSYRTIPCQELCKEDMRILNDKARHMGDKLAVVVAKTQQGAIEGARKVKITFNELQALPDAKKSLENPQVSIHEGSNVVGECSIDYGEIPPCAKADAVETKSDIFQQSMYHAAMENHVYISDYDGRKITIYTPTQGIYGIRTVVGDYMGMRYSDIRVIKSPMGGSFGGKQEFLLEPLMAFLAKEFSCPIRLSLNRQEDITSTLVRAAHDFKIKTLTKKDGKLLSFEVDDILDAGAYVGSSVDQINAMMKKVTRQYKVPHYSHTAKAVYTNTVQAGGMRGWGSPEMFTAVEMHMNAIANQLGIDQVEFRKTNMVRCKDIEPLSGVSLGDCRPVECMELGSQKFGWDTLSKEPHGEGRYKTGVGVACGAHKNGMLGFPDVTSLTLKMNEDGSLNLIGCYHEVGCGTLRSMQIIVAQALDTDPDNILVTEGDTETTPYDAGTYGSRVTYVMGKCAQTVSEMLRARIIGYAAKLFGCDEAQVEIKDGGAGVKNTDRHMGYRELATRVLLEYQSDLIVTATHGARDNPGVYTAHFAKVQVDTLTGFVKILKYVVAQDVGVAINKLMVEGQIQGGVQMGIGYALCEDMGVNEKGRIVNNSFKKYHIINMYDMPEVEVYLVEEGGDNGPYGAKSVGEIATVPAAAAIVNAVNDALGTCITTLPLTCERIVAEVKKQRGI